VSQGDHVKITKKSEISAKLPFFLKRVESWDFSRPLILKIEALHDSRSLNQNALFHIWCRQMSASFIEKVPDASESGIKFMMKSLFLGTQTIKIGAQVFRDQIQPLPKDKGSMWFFMDQVYHWASEKGVFLSLPEYNEYSELKRKQDQ
tara:strand:+ start:58 stop:501 length:444 start_codon:yes stop_codon:yes gene_type:complete